MESTIHKTLITYVDAFIKNQLKISVCFFQQEKGKSFYFCVFFLKIFTNIQSFKFFWPGYNNNFQ